MSEAPGEAPPVLEERGHGDEAEEEGAPGGQDDPEEAVEEGEVRPPSGHEAAVSIEHQHAPEYEAEEKSVVVNDGDGVAEGDKNAAEGRSQARILIKNRSPAKEEEADGTEEAWGWKDFSGHITKGLGAWRT